MVDATKRKHKGKRVVLPQSVIDFYARFRNENPLKVSLVMGNKFEMEERYEILDLS